MAINVAMFADAGGGVDWYFNSLLTPVELVAAMQAVAGALGFRVNLTPGQLDRMPTAFNVRLHDGGAFPPASAPPARTVEERENDLDAAFKDFLVDEPGHIG